MDGGIWRGLFRAGMVALFVVSVRGEMMPRAELGASHPAEGTEVVVPLLPGSRQTLKQALAGADRVYVGRIESIDVDMGPLGASRCNTEVTVREVLKGHEVADAKLSLTFLVQTIPDGEAAPANGGAYIFFLKAKPQRTFEFVKMLPITKLGAVRQQMAAPEVEAKVWRKSAWGWPLPGGVEIRVWNTFDLDWERTASVASGGIESAAHQTMVSINVNPPGARAVPVSLAGGLGHAGEHNARLVFGATVIGPGETKLVTTEKDGTAMGMLTSSNLRNQAIIGSGRARATVTFDWDTDEGFSNWDQDRYGNTPGENSNMTFTIKHEGVPIDGHTIAFYVERVEYVDFAGRPQVVLDTIEHPDDPADPVRAHHVGFWARFVPTKDVTSADGVAPTTVYWINHPGWAWLGIREATSMRYVAYDMTIWSQ